MQLRLLTRSKKTVERFWSNKRDVWEKRILGVADFKVIISDSEIKSDLLNKKLSDVYTKEDLTTIPAAGDSPKPTLV